jgi:hypothetical protein
LFRLVVDPACPQPFIIGGSKPLLSAIGAMIGIDHLIRRGRNLTTRTQSQNRGTRSSYPLSTQLRVPVLVSEFV